MKMAARSATNAVGAMTTKAMHRAYGEGFGVEPLLRRNTAVWAVQGHGKGGNNCRKQQPALPCLPHERDAPSYCL